MSLTEIPVAERIVEAVATRLQNVPYATSIVREYKQHGEWTPQNLQIVVKLSALERFPAFDCPGNPAAIAWKATIKLFCQIMQSESDNIPIETGVHRFTADVMKTLTTPYASWHTWDDLAINSMIGNPTISTEDGFDCGTVPVEVYFRHDEDDPFAVR